MGERGRIDRRADMTISGWVDPDDFDLDWQEIEPEIGVQLTQNAKRGIRAAMRHRHILRDAQDALPRLGGRGRSSIASQIAATRRQLRNAEGARRRRLERALAKLTAAKKAARDGRHSPYSSPARIKRAMVHEVRRAVEAEIEIDAPPRKRASGLTPFQALIRTLEIHPANSDDSFCAWLAESLKH